MSMSKMAQFAVAVAAAAAAAVMASREAVSAASCGGSFNFLGGKKAKVGGGSRSVLSSSVGADSPCDMAVKVCALVTAMSLLGQ